MGIYVSDSEARLHKYGSAGIHNSPALKTTPEGTTPGNPSIDLSDYATKEFVTGKISILKEQLDAIQTFSGDYNDLLNKPEIPDVTNFITDEIVTTKLQDYLKLTDNAITNVDLNGTIYLNTPQGKFSGINYEPTYNVLMIGNQRTQLNFYGSPDKVPSYNANPIQLKQVQHIVKIQVKINAVNEIASAVIWSDRDTKYTTALEILEDLNLNNKYGMALPLGSCGSAYCILTGLSMNQVLNKPVVHYYKIGENTTSFTGDDITVTDTLVF